MITFECPRCHQPIDAIEDRSVVTCEHCGEIVSVPLRSEVDTLTIAELQALRNRAGQGPGTLE
jgi:hypothetical protein